jgi:hypothetical protein
LQKYPSFTFVIASHPFCSVPESHTNPEPAQSIFVIANEVRQSMPPLFRRWIATACGLAMTTLTAWIATACGLAMTALVQGCVRYQTGYGGSY